MILLKEQKEKKRQPELRAKERCPVCHHHTFRWKDKNEVNARQPCLITYCTFFV